jgi:beta-glucosidase
LIRALAATGKPVVLVLFGGRPNALGDIEPLCRAIVQAWYPGEEGGNAVADALLGNINFAGKLTLTMPRTTAQCPISHRLGYDTKNPPLYPFGHGLSYTTFKYDGLTVPPTVATGAKEFSAEFSLANSGTCEGVEVVQLYVTFPDEAKCRPPLELKGFARVSLKPREIVHVTIRIPMQMLAAFNPEMKLWEIRPGRYQIKVGASSTDIRLKAEILMTGDTVTMPQRTEFMSQTFVVPAIDLPNTPASATGKFTK